MPSPSPTPTSITLFGIKLHSISLAEAVPLLIGWMRDETACRYVVTPNLDHVVKFQSHAEMRDAYQGASLVVADGWPLVASSRLFGKGLPERVAGSDLVPSLLAAGNNLGDFRVFLLGGAPGVGEQAKSKIEARWRHVFVCGLAAPPRGFEHDPQLSEALVAEINSCEPDFIIVGLGAPKQEIWLRKYAPRIRRGVAIAAGATIDFLAGVQPRAPKWVQEIHCEWLYRLASNPKRLAGRYAMDALVFPMLLAKELFHHFIKK